MNKNELLLFFNDEDVEKAKRKITDVWGFTEDELEEEHDYIQWIFPTFQRSKYNSDDPIFTKSIVDEIKKDDVALTNIRVSLDTMMAFFGWRITDGDNDVEQIKTKKEMKWLQKPHNFLRITRILSSLQIFGLYRLNELFFLAMCRTIKQNLNHKELVDSFIKYWLPTQRYYLGDKVDSYNINLMKKK